MILVVYVPFLQPFFDTVSLSLNDWVLMIPFILMASIAAELTKIYIRYKAAKLANVPAVG